MSTPPQQGHLLKVFGLGMAIILVISNIIGSGVFKKVAPMSELMGSPSLVLMAYVLAGVITIFGVLCAAEAASMFPDSGGAYTWLSEMYGKVFGFMYGWTCFTVILTAAIASLAVIFAQALGSFIDLPHLSPQLESITWLADSPDPIRPFADMGAKLVAVALIWVLTFFNIRGAKIGGNISMVFTAAIVAGIAVVIGISFFGGTGNMENLQAQVRNVTTNLPESKFSSAAEVSIWAAISVMIVAMRHAFWAYEGWISLGYLGGEIKNPGKNLPKALILGILGVIVIYVVVNTAYLYAMPINNLVHPGEGESAVAAVRVMDYVLGNKGGVLIAGLILISTFGCANTTILSASRIYYSMAQKGEFFKSAAFCHPVFNTPSKSLVMQATWASILALSGSFDFLTTIIILAAFVFYGAVAAGIIVLRRKMPDAERPYKTLGYPWVPVIFVLFSIALMIVSFIESPVYGGIGLLLIFSGLPFYYFSWRRPRNS
jgi:APA family basic amino acid/polyamine antiporter